jgi:cyclase
MLKRRIIPKLQMRAARLRNTNRMVLITTVQFEDTLEIGDPVSQAKIYEAQAADELIFLDLDASRENRNIITSVIKKAAEQIFMPLTVGGGVRTVDDFRTLLSNGADKVSINTAAVYSPELINQATEQFGSQCVILSIDYRQDGKGGYRVWTRGGKEETELDPVEWAVKGEKRGAGEILLTSIDRDGTRQGLDLEITRRISENVSIPVITSGGCGSAAHFVDGFLLGGADAVSAGTYFCFKDENPMQTRSQIKNAGIPIRLHT